MRRSGRTRHGSLSPSRARLDDLPPDRHRPSRIRLALDLRHPTSVPDRTAVDRGCDGTFGGAARRANATETGRPDAVRWTSAAYGIPGGSTKVLDVARTIRHPIGTESGLHSRECIHQAHSGTEGHDRQEPLPDGDDPSLRLAWSGPAARGGAAHPGHQRRGPQWREVRLHATSRRPTSIDPRPRAIRAAFPSRPSPPRRPRAIRAAFPSRRPSRPS